MQVILLLSRYRPEGTRTHGAALLSLWLLLEAILLMTGLPASSWGQGGYERRILFENASVQVVRLNYPPGRHRPCTPTNFPAGRYMSYRGEPRNCCRAETQARPGQ